MQNAERSVKTWILDQRSNQRVSEERRDVPINQMSGRRNFARVLSSERCAFGTSEVFDEVYEFQVDDDTSAAFQRARRAIF